MKTQLKLFILCTFLLLFVIQVGSDDKELFMGLDTSNLDQVKPNVVILMDSSGSMNSIITYPRNPADINLALPTPGYDPKTDYSGSVEGATDDPWYNSSPRFMCRWINGTTAEDYNRQISIVTKTDEDTFTLNIVEDNDYNDFIQVDDWVRDSNNNGYAQIASKDGSGGVTLKNRVGTFTGTHFYFNTNDGYPFRAAYLYGVDEENDPLYNFPAGGGTTRYPRNYMNWMFLHATDAHREAISYFSVNGTFVVGDPPVSGITECECADVNVVQRLFTRIQVAREVICKVFASSNQIANLGLYKFEAPSSGAELMEGLQDASDENTLNQLHKRTYLTIANSWTPLAEALADIWRDMKPAANNVTYWPADYEFDTLHLTHNTSVPNSPITWYCQKNFVVIMTDGESTQDQFDNSKYTTDPQYGAASYGTIFTSKPIKRLADWENWDHGWGDLDENEASWDHRPSGYDPDTAEYCPNYTCWQSSGSDYLDDVAYFLAHQDMFPSGPGMFSDDPSAVNGFPDDQIINTYVIGFNMDNDMLKETAHNGGGEYYTGDDYNQMVTAFQKVFDSIKVRSYAFASITAPRRSTSTSSESISYIGFFIPSTTTPIWDGYLWAYKLFDTWGWDADTSGEIDKSGDPTINEFTYTSLEACMAASGGNPCERWLRLSASREYDVAAVLRDQGDRNLWTYLFKTWWFDTDSEGDYDEDELYSTQAACEAANPGESCAEVAQGKYIEFTIANEPELRSHLAVTTAADGLAIINEIRKNHLADIFHSDVNFIGPPPYGKKYQPKINPLDPDGEQYIDFYDDYKDRTRVLTVGTNDGVFHMLDANESMAAGGGTELYGYIPDMVLPNLRNMVIGDGTLPAQHTFTVDGRTSTESIYFTKAGDDHPSWITMAVFGLRDGGRSFYALDTTDTSPTAVSPTVMWKFKDDTYSGNSWSNPLFGKIYQEESGDIVDKHVVVLTGGMAYNHENPNDLKGKAVFVVDAVTGELIWMVGYNPAGVADVSGTPELETSTLGGDTKRYLTRDSVFNFPIPSSITTLDRNNDGLLDTLYFANLGGHVFKVDMSAKDPADWKTYHLFRSYVTTSETEAITGVAGNIVSVKKADNFPVGQLVAMVNSSVTDPPLAFGYVKGEDKGDLDIVTLFGTFQTGKYLVAKTYNPIFLAPAVARDDCSKLWVTFGTGDRDRPRSNLSKGQFVAFLDSGDTDLTTSDLQELTWTDDEIDELPTGTTVDKGWYFYFPDDAEKMFDPDPYIMPDDYMTAHIHFNTFQPPFGLITSDNPCSITEGGMTRYDITIENCLPIVIDGERDTGRIAGGGMYEGGEYVTYTSETGMVADVPVKDDGGEELLYKTKSQKFPYPGGLIFLREITR